MTSDKGRHLDENAKCWQKNASFDENDDEKGFLDLFVFSHLIHVEDQKSGLETVSLRRGIAYEPKQTMSHLIFVCPFKQNKPCRAFFKLQCI